MESTDNDEMTACVDAKKFRQEMFVVFSDDFFNDSDEVFLEYVNK